MWLATQMTSHLQMLTDVDRQFDGRVNSDQQVGDLDPSQTQVLASKLTAVKISRSQGPNEDLIGPNESQDPGPSRPTNGSERVQRVHRVWVKSALSSGASEHGSSDPWTSSGTSSTGSQDPPDRFKSCAKGSEWDPICLVALTMFCSLGFESATCSSKSTRSCHHCFWSAFCTNFGLCFPPKFPRHSSRHLECLLLFCQQATWVCFCCNLWNNPIKCLTFEFHNDNNEKPKAENKCQLESVTKNTLKLLFENWTVTWLISPCKVLKMCSCQWRSSTAICVLCDSASN